MPIEGEAVGAEFATAANIRLDCVGSATFSADASSPANDCCVCRRNAARPANISGESPGTSGTSPSADGDNPAADNSVDASGFTSESGAGCTSGISWAVVDVDSSTDRVDTSTTDPSFAGGVVTGSDLGCTEAVVFVPGASAVTSLLDGALSPVRFFGFFGVDAAADVSEPDFLSLIVAAADFSPVPLLPLPFATPSSAVLSLTSVVDSAASSPDGPDDWEDPAVLDDEESDESELEDEEELDEDEESDDELDELEEPVSVGSAQATPGVVATATPTPKATAKPPTRPMYLA
jgi:hypothetical protein